MDKNNVPNGLITQLKSDGIEVKYRSGELIYKQNAPLSHLYWIESGMVKIFKETKNHREIITNVCGKGEFIEILSLWNNQVCDFSAEAIEETKVILLDKVAFTNLFLLIPENSNYLLRLTSAQSLQTINRLIAINQKQLPGRVADLVLYFYTLFDNNATFRFPLNRRELAHFAGTTKESLIRTLTEFKNDRIIELNDREVKINSMEIVKTLSRLG
jgi:CRP-like cAMP-binding protein